jgi:hypothetical protein
MRIGVQANVVGIASRRVGDYTSKVVSMVMNGKIRAASFNDLGWCISCLVMVISFRCIAALHIKFPVVDIRRSGSVRRSTDEAAPHSASLR